MRITVALMNASDVTRDAPAVAPSPSGACLDDGATTADIANFAAPSAPGGALRAGIRAITLQPERDCIASLLAAAELDPGAETRARDLARRLVEALRAKGQRGPVEKLMRAYDLSTREGVALMCLAEALLRIPDAPTRDALIRDKIGTGNWRAHLADPPSLFASAASWSLVITGRLVGSPGPDDAPEDLWRALSGLLRRGGEPVVRAGLDLAMRVLGGQFVTGRTIAEALDHARHWEGQGFTYSYDMLGESATTAADANRYAAAYADAIAAIGAASRGRGPYAGPGISIKLSALHPRYVRSQRGRVMAELLPRVADLAAAACAHNIGLNIDAEEADRLDLSLDILAALAADPRLAGWNGLGFVVQAYGKRAPAVIDFLVDLARCNRRRLMVRLVKGAYWDAEIKRAQVEGLADFPVFTRKVHTDISYAACARKLLAARDAVFPQFATHNARTLATVLAMAGPGFQPGDYEFQCLHGMGEALYEEVVGETKLNRPCRIYAPVGSHETLLAYLVRRLLENGANASFVNRIADESVPVEALVADPVAAVRRSTAPGAPHDRIARPRDLLGVERVNAIGLDLSNEAVLDGLVESWVRDAGTVWRATTTGQATTATPSPVHNPADPREVVGLVRCAGSDDIERVLAAASEAASGWAATRPQARAAALRRAADAFEERMPSLLGLIMREAGKTVTNAVAEVREAVDFLRYYGAQIERAAGCACVRGQGRPLGPVVCISPWNFPLAIFVGQVAAALAAGNAVLAKPAEETPLIAAEAVRLLHAAGIPDDVLHLVPGAGEVGADLVGDARVQGVIFTGSTTVARSIQRQLADRLTTDGLPVPLIAETGGQNALVVDSSALAEQVVSDVMASAFDSVGQRCSALRILCLQDEVADRVLTMLKGAMRELRVGDPRRLSTDVGPVISQESVTAIKQHIAAMRARGHRVTDIPLGAETGRGTFVSPTIIEIDRVGDIEQEVFGPVLHVLRYHRENIDALIDDINATGYGLTFGIHSRIEETVSRVVERAVAGNIYVNRNIIGAVVGVQPFGGSGLSGTGPKAGGPRYLRRLLAEPRPEIPAAPGRSAPGRAAPGRAASVPAAGAAYLRWLHQQGHVAVAARIETYLDRSRHDTETDLSGPVGERNIYMLRPRGRIAALFTTDLGALIQVGAILATGNTAVIVGSTASAGPFRSLPPEAARGLAFSATLGSAQRLRGILHEGEADALRRLNQEVACWEGPIVLIHSIGPNALASGRDYEIDDLLEERCLTINTAAAGGNASLMSLEA